MAKKFFAAIGNPPYQEPQQGQNDGYAPPVYDKFLDAAYKIADKVEMIHPARFLFNAGSTKKAWNEKMLNDPHLKVLMYQEDASRVFSNTDIKGGVAITYRDASQDYGAIQVFLKHEEMNEVLRKVTRHLGFIGMDTISVSRTVYRLTDAFHADYPDARYHEDAEGNNLGQLSKGHDYDMATNIFERIPQVFHDTRPDDNNEYIRILGRIGNGRMYKWIRQDYVNAPKPLFAWSIVLPKANNTGRFGEVLSQPVITAPGIGSTETFLSVGYFKTEEEAKNCLGYLSTKFARTLLGVLKTTQDLTPDKWKFVPLQDFTSASDIDWSRSIAEIDQQLYQKYGLTNEEIEFIETHVKEMK